MYPGPGGPAIQIAKERPLPAPCLAPCSALTASRRRSTAALYLRRKTLSALARRARAPRPPGCSPPLAALLLEVRRRRGGLPPLPPPLGERPDRLRASPSDPRLCSRTQEGRRCIKMATILGFLQVLTVSACALACSSTTATRHATSSASAVAAGPSPACATGPCSCSCATALLGSEPAELLERSVPVEEADDNVANGWRRMVPGNHECVDGPCATMHKCEKCGDLKLMTVS
ncbi:Glutamate receptor ionotropic, kainate 4 [Frankliniella fusca]|uniref:Glutamate receptor ionotropic, kainate 4 n=1 Tax=Frankliniella fusca TaxID=407009 RepID=A0AAE1LPK8_9NEOP|nr:Glutamate receptor ionotropic, kainate 4 [Frankliniella fusca]